MVFTEENKILLNRWGLAERDGLYSYARPKSILTILCNKNFSFDRGEIISEEKARQISDVVLDKKAPLYINLLCLFFICHFLYFSPLIGYLFSDIYLSIMIVLQLLIAPAFFASLMFLIIIRKIRIIKNIYINK